MAPTDAPDDLHDAALVEDIALLGDVMAAAADDGGRAPTEAEVDQALVSQPRNSAPNEPAPPPSAVSKGPFQWGSDLGPAALSVA